MVATMVENPKSCPQHPKKIVVCISGMAGTGKSTLSRKLAEKYNLKCYSGGDALKELAAAEGYDVARQGWWEGPEGLKFLGQRGKDPKFDQAVDTKLMEYATLGNVLLDSWTMPWLLKEGYKIWLMASFERRAARVAVRDKISVQDAFKVLGEKEARTKEIFQNLYGFALDEDFAPFDLVLDTDNLSADEVFGVLCQVMDKVVFSAPTAEKILL
jgi:CMP/dCMP kinase